MFCHYDIYSLRLHVRSRLHRGPDLALRHRVVLGRTHVLHERRRMRQLRRLQRLRLPARHDRRQLRNKYVQGFIQVNYDTIDSKHGNHGSTISLSLLISYFYTNRGFVNLCRQILSQHVLKFRKRKRDVKQIQVYNLLKLFLRVRYIDVMNIHDGNKHDLII